MRGRRLLAFTIVVTLVVVILIWKLFGSAEVTVVVAVIGLVLTIIQIFPAQGSSPGNFSQFKRDPTSTDDDSYVSSRSNFRLSKVIINIISGVFILILLAGLLIGAIYFLVPDPFCKNVYKITNSKIFCRGIFALQTIQVKGDKLSVGLSDGNNPFDLGYDDQNTAYSNFKQQASQDFSTGNTDAAINEWSKAINIVTDDAESMIYIENANVLASHQHYITIIVATTLSVTFNDRGASIRVAEDDLRGVFVAQKEFNQQHPDLKVLIVLANLGIKSQDYLAQTESPVLDKIKRLVATDDTVIGVVGFPFSIAAQTAIPVLSAEHIPMISPSASSNVLSNLSPYFFRIAPPDAEQGKDAAQFASQVLDARQVAVFSDSSNPYSKSLAESFANNFSSLGSEHAVISEPFTLGSPDTLDASVNNVLSRNNIDMIFMAGYADDLNSLKDKLGPSAYRISLMGGDASYEFGGYTEGNYNNIYFTSFMYPDTWNILCPPRSSCASLAPAVTVAQNYSAIFDPKKIHVGQYGYARPGPHVLLSYDATLALLKAADNVLANGESLSLDVIRNALQNVSFQGATGQIAFSGSDPINKTVLMLCVDQKHHTQLVQNYGQFAQGAKKFAPDINEIRYQLCA
jgi:ABC-type branched-subunit amino acid transport system substrate-binding protein